MRRALVTFGLMVGLGIGSTIGFAAHADDDGADQSFLIALRQVGLTYSDPVQTVSAGKTVCSLASSGVPGAEIVRRLQEANPRFTTNSAGQFAAIAAQAYCPRTLTGGS